MYCKICNKIGHKNQAKAVAHSISLSRKDGSKYCKIKTFYNKQCGMWHVGRNKFDKMNQIFEIISQQKMLHRAR